MGYGTCLNKKTSVRRETSSSVHIDELRISKLFNYLDVFAFNETRLVGTVSNDEIRVLGFDIIRKDWKRNGGGVCIYARNSHNYCVRDDLVPDDLEAVCVGKKTNSKPFIVCTVYRPPESPRDFFVSLENMVKVFHDLDIEFHLLGDLNGNLLIEIPDQETKLLKTLYETYQLSQIIKKPD